jgi:molybdenum cofactor guanylyltransferase
MVTGFDPFLLAGGDSRRMGRDKARLPLQNLTLLERQMQLLQQVFGKAHLLAPEDRYADLGFSGLPDLRSRSGPLAGLETALRMAQQEWILLLAVDLPHVDATLLTALTAQPRRGQAMVCATPDGRRHPLCALYHCGILPVVQQQLDTVQLRMHDLLALIATEEFRLADNRSMANWNSPSDLTTWP